MNIALKPMIPPVVVLACSIAFQFSLEKWGGDVPTWWLAMLVGAVICWLLLSIIKNVRLIDSYPKLLDWFPFLGTERQRRESSIFPRQSFGMGEGTR